jgi:hypothetical protein
MRGALVYGACAQEEEERERHRPGSEHEGRYREPHRKWDNPDDGSRTACWC